MLNPIEPSLVPIQVALFTDTLLLSTGRLKTWQPSKSTWAPAGVSGHLSTGFLIPSSSKSLLVTAIETVAEELSLFPSLALNVKVSDPK